MTKVILSIAFAASVAAAIATAGARSVPNGAAKSIVLVHGAITDGSGWRGVHDRLASDVRKVPMFRVQFADCLTALFRCLRQRQQM